MMYGSPLGTLGLQNATPEYQQSLAAQMAALNAQANAAKEAVKPTESRDVQEAIRDYFDHVKQNMTKEKTEMDRYQEGFDAALRQAHETRMATRAKRCVAMVVIFYFLAAIWTGVHVDARSYPLKDGPASVICGAVWFIYWPTVGMAALHTKLFGDKPATP